MLELNDLQILAQLIDNMEILNNKLEKSYNDNDGETFNRTRKEILDVQKKIAEILNQ